MTVYDTLNGGTTIKEPYGYHRYLSFCVDKRGHMKSDFDCKSFESLLFEKMCSNHELCGKFELKKNVIVWNLCDGYIITIAQDYLDISNKLFGRIENSLHHWHPDDDDMYDDICKLGTSGNVTVIHTTILYSEVVYSGPENMCKIKRKWLFGRYYYLYAKKWLRPNRRKINAVIPL